MFDELDKIEFDLGYYFWLINMLKLRDPSLEGVTLLDQVACFVLVRCKCNLRMLFMV